MSAEPMPGRCGGKKKESRGGGYCEKPAGWGTEHPGFGYCKFHMGATPAMNVRAAHLELQAAFDAMTTFGIAEDAGEAASPHQIMVQLINRQSSVVRWLELKLALIPNTEASLTDQQGEFGPTIPTVWIRMRGDESDRLAKYCKMAADMGVAERAIRIAEQQGLLIARVFENVFDDLGLSEDQQRRLPAIMRTRLLEIPALEAQLAA